MGMLTNGDAWIRTAQEELAKFETECVTQVRTATQVLVENLFGHTPVWSGETVRNYVVGFNVRPSGGSKGNLGPKPPLRPTGGTPIGSEDNRPANEAAARSDMNAALSGMKKLGTVYITNTIDAAKWDLIDNGSAPTKQSARNPGGVSILAEQSARNKLEHFK